MLDIRPIFSFFPPHTERLFHYYCITLIQKALQLLEIFFFKPIKQKPKSHIINTHIKNTCVLALQHSKQQFTRIAALSMPPVSICSSKTKNLKYVH